MSCAILSDFREQNEDELENYFRKKYSNAHSLEHAGEDKESDEILQKALMPTQKFVPVLNIVSLHVKKLSDLKTMDETFLSLTVCVAY